MPRAKSIAVVYDGDCQFCMRSLRLLKRFDPGGVMRLYDSHDTETVAAAFPMLAGADFDQAMFAVSEQGAVSRGYFAFKAIVRALPLTWLILPLFYVPGSNALGPRAYAWVARNRRRFGCASDACDLPTRPSGRGRATP